MLGRTHDLIAFSSVSYIAAVSPLPHLSFATVLVAVSSNQLGAILPDIDQPTGHLWRKVPAGSLIGRMICPLFGGHRFISHSLVGVIIVALGARFVLAKIHTVLLVDMNIVWVTFMIGYCSHLLADMVTVEGIPLFFPFGYKVGIPPFKHLRMKTGGFIEKLIIFPGFSVLTIYIFYSHYHHFLTYLHSYIH